MTPADLRQHALGVGHEDRLVPDVAEVPRAVPIEQLEDLVRSRRAGEPGDGRIGRRFIPRVHRLAERLLGLGGVRQTRFVHRLHPPAALLHVAGLRILEVVERPEEGQPAIRVGGRKSGPIDRVDGHHRVELEPHRGPRLDVPHPGQQQGSQNLLVTETLADPRPDDLQQPLAGRLLQQANQRFDVRQQGDRAGRQSGLGSGHGGQIGQKRKPAETQHGAAGRGAMQKTSPVDTLAHGQISSIGLMIKSLRAPLSIVAF